MLISSVFGDGDIDGCGLEDEDDGGAVGDTSILRRST